MGAGLGPPRLARQLKLVVQTLSGPHLESVGELANRQSGLPPG